MDDQVDSQPSLATVVHELLTRYGQRKEMGSSSPGQARPHFFLLRRFFGDIDLLVILNTKRCRYQCSFCQLPAKSSLSYVEAKDIVNQFRYVVEEVKHTISIVDRVTLSNEGSMLDSSTVSDAALNAIIDGIVSMRRVRRIVIETRLEFATKERLVALARRLPLQTALDILTGFESVSTQIRDKVLGKREPISTFLAGLDNLASVGASLTAYVLFKPDPVMTDAQAYGEASDSIDFLRGECASRNIPLTIRLNPMYVADGSKWARLAKAMDGYQPPRLTDVVELAESWTKRDVRIYIGLSTEGLAGDAGTYRSRSDYGPDILRRAKSLNSLAKGPTSVD